MNEFIEIAKTSDLTNGQMKGYTLGNSKVLLARVDNNFYAASNVCPHMGGTLSEGILTGTIVTCPRHGSQFDLKNGSVIRWTKYTGVFGGLVKMLKSPRPLHTYKLHIAGESIKVKIL